MIEKKLKITKRAHAFKRHTCFCNVEILKSFNSELQLEDNKSPIKNKPKKLLIELRRFKFVTALVLVLKRIESDDKTIYNTFYSRSKAEKVINESDIDNVFESIYTTIISNMQKLSKERIDWYSKFWW